MVEQVPGPGGGRPTCIGEPDAAWNELLDQKQRDLYIAYAKAIDYDLPMTSDGNVDWDYRTDGNLGQRYLPGEQAEVHGAAGLEWELSPFRDVCDERWLRKLPDGVSLSRLDDAIQKIPEDGAAVFERIKEHISGDSGPAANQYRWYIGALNWSLDFQRKSLTVISGVAAVYRAMCEQMRKDVEDILDQAISGLNDVAESGKGEFNVDLLKFAVDSVFTAASSASPAGAAKAIGVDFTRFMIQQGIDERQASVKASGDAQAIMGAAGTALTELERKVTEETKKVREALADVRDRMDEAIYKPGADRGSYSSLRIPAPSVVKASRQQKDDWAG